MHLYKIGDILETSDTRLEFMIMDIHRKNEWVGSQYLILFNDGNTHSVWLDTLDTNKHIRVINV